MKHFVIMATMLIATSVFANGSLNLTLPTPAQNFQSDKFRAGELDCSNAIGGGTNLEFGVTGLVDNGVEENFLDDPKRVGVYGRITIPLDGPKERINCNILYELELRKKRLEIQRLEQELQQLRQLQFEN
jgi:hypothetical protein